MRTPKPPPKEVPIADSDRVWPLDLSIAALAGLVLYLVVTQLKFDDPRPLFNAWTYAVAVPVIALVLAIICHGLVSRQVQKSIQLGFLFSVFVHLLLLLLAINVIIFSNYFPDAFTGTKRERNPVRQTVPEYLFQTPNESASAPDWTKPVEVETTSRIVPEEQRRLPPVEQSAPKLKMPRQRERQRRPMRKFLMKRDQPVESQPQPSDSPAKLARQQSTQSSSLAMSTSTPKAPETRVEAVTKSEAPDRKVSQRRRSRQSSASISSATPSQLPTDQPQQRPKQRSLAGARNRTNAMPRVGESGVSRQRRQSKPRSMQPAGSAPTAQTVAVAQQVEAADRMMAPTDIPMTRQAQSVGAEISIAQNASTSPSTSRSQVAGGTASARNNQLAQSGMPNVSPGNAASVGSRARRQTVGIGFEPTGAPDAAQSIAAAAIDDNGIMGDEVSDVVAGEAARLERRSSQTGGSTTPSLSTEIGGALTLEMLLEEGSPGLANEPNRRPGVIPTEQQPMVAALDLSRSPRRRREVGGPVTPAGAEIAAVESFSRRVMRTRGGAAPTPAGQVGPATEEAIENGLAYLASIQNSDGSWSLQGHGTNVILRSDTAATGLCLLSFQGAGYTHMQHQYADTVSRGLKFLIDNQKTNGDLYRSENELSDRNVAFYSHGIASLALCEAYGMTQDTELRTAAQGCLNYIAGTQHRERGGWRYTAQVSADTSVTGWMMMSLKSGQLSGLEVRESTYDGINQWLRFSQASPERTDRYRYNPFAPDTPTQRHGRTPTPTMTAVGMLMRMYQGWKRDKPTMKSAADYLLKYKPQMGTKRSPQRDAYYWYYATQVMFHMGGEYWEKWNQALTPILLESQVKNGPKAGSWDPQLPIADRWSPHAGRLYVTTMNLLNLEVYYRHLPIYEETAE